MNFFWAVLLFIGGVILLFVVPPAALGCFVCAWVNLCRGLRSGD